VSNKPRTLTPLRIALRIYAFLAFVPLGLMHVFMPDTYFAAIKYEVWDPEDPVQWEMVRLIGSFFIALAFGAWRVSVEPLRNRDLFIVLLIAMFLTVSVVAYTISIGVAPPAVWWNTVLPYSVLWVLLISWYPWREAAARLSPA
jgi:hypothetical protein